MRVGGQEQRRTRTQEQRVGGQEDRARIRTTGQEQRTTDLQQEMFRRYKENRDFEQARGSYRV